MAERTATPSHDRLFRILMEDPVHGPSLVRSLLPPPAAGLIADSQIERVSGTFTDNNLQLHQTDALFRADLPGGSPALIYILIEHKSTRDPWAPLQMARYIVRIWTRYADLPEARPGVLPPVIPVLVHHGRQPWSGPLSVLDMVERPGPIADLTGSLSCVLFDLTAAETAELPGNRTGRSVLAAMKHARDRPAADEVLDKILSGPDEGSKIELSLVDYLAKNYVMETETLEAALQRARPGRWEILMETVADQLIRAKKAELIASSKAETLLRLAGLKFGSVPETRAGEIRTADVSDLDRWLDA